MVGLGRAPVPAQCTGTVAAGCLLPFQCPGRMLVALVFSLVYGAGDTGNTGGVNAAGGFLALNRVVANDLGRGKHLVAGAAGRLVSGNVAESGGVAGHRLLQGLQVKFHPNLRCGFLLCCPFCWNGCVGSSRDPKLPDSFLQLRRLMLGRLLSVNIVWHYFILSSE